MRKHIKKEEATEDLPDDTGVISNFGEDETFDDSERYNVLDVGDKALAAAFGEDYEYTVRLMRLTSVTEDGKQIAAPVDITFRQLSMAEVIGLQRGDKTDTSNRVNPALWLKRTLKILRAGILSHDIVETEKGRADYRNGEISVKDFNPGELSLLLEMVAPGSQKSREDIAKRSLSILRVARKDVQDPTESCGEALQGGS